MTLRNEKAGRLVSVPAFSAPRWVLDLAGFASDLEIKGFDPW